MFPVSIRWRFLWWLALLLAILLIGFGVTAWRLSYLQQIARADAELRQWLGQVSQDIRPQPGGPPNAWRGDRRGPSQGGFRPDEERNTPFEPRRQRHIAPPNSLPSPSSPETSPVPPPATLAPDSESFITPTPIPMEDQNRPFPPRGPGFARTIIFSSTIQALFAEGTKNAPYAAVWSRDGVLTTKTSTFPPEIATTSPPLTNGSLQFRTRGPSREAFQLTDFGEILLVGRSLDQDMGALHRLAWWLTAAGSAVLLLGLGGGWWLAGRALRPLEEMSDAASQISAGTLSERLESPGTGHELTRLADVLNTAFARLEAAFDRQRQFTADASHELRTPLAVIVSEAQTTLARERSAQEYREALEICLGAAQQMRRLADALLDLARLDRGQEILECDSIDLAELAASLLQLIQPLALSHHLHVTSDLQPTLVHGDAQRLSQIILNLLTNAIHYNHDGGSIHLATSREGTTARLSVTDSGRGIAAEDLPHVFDRFYRTDHSRQRSTGGTGLGLAICLQLATAHGGTITVSSEPDQGSTFTLTLPTKPNSETVL